MGVGRMTADWLTGVLLLLLLLLSAFFSSSETALFSLSRSRVRRLRDQGGAVGRAIAELLRRPRRLLITILVGNMLVNTAVSSMIAEMVTRQFGVEALGMAVVVTTPLLLLFGEVTPKTLAIVRPLELARLVALPLSFFAVLFTPLRVVLRLTTNVLLRLLRQGHVQSEALLTREEFQATLRSGKVSGGIDANEAEVIHAIAGFHTTKAREIMVPRPEIVAVPGSATLADALVLARRVRHPRLPVYQGSIDHIRSILNLKALPLWRAHVSMQDTLETVGERAAGVRPAPARPLLTAALTVPALRPVDAVFADLRASGEHLAILLDEYGGTAGMVTRDNILDTLLGGLLGCTPRRTFLQMRPNGDVLASGSYRVRQLNWECGFRFDNDAGDTLAGYVTRVAGCVPSQGQAVRDKQVEFTIVQVTRQRIDLVLIHPLPEDDSE